MKDKTLRSLLMAGCLILAMPAVAQESDSLPQLPPFPEIPEKRPVNSVKMRSSNSFGEVQLDIPITEGPYQANWVSIEKNYPGTPQWLRDAKFGIWVHFGPQSAGESGDWYARRLYNEEDGAYENHKKRFGHPSEKGYKDVLRTWNPTQLDPDYLTKIYQEAGARFLMIQGVHHDNYDLWNSRYQPWNSMNIGPKRDLLGEWTEACHKYGMRYGVTFHHEYTWWWWQTAFGCDSKGDKAGIPYDGNLTPEDGVGTWWEGYDPRMLYGIDLREYETLDERAHTPWAAPSDGIFYRHLDYCKWYATQWALRMMDVVANYDPDFIYTDGTVQGPFTGNGTGTGYKCNAMQTVMADYYNRQLKRRGEVDAFTIIKFRSPTNGTITTEEFDFPSDIRTDQDWIREAPIGDWFYAPGFVYDAASVIRFIVEAASRDGNAALNVCLDPSGAIDAKCVSMLKYVGKWMAANGEAIYGSHAWKVLGEGENGNINKLNGGALGSSQANQNFTAQDIRYTVGRDGTLYAICMATPKKGQKVTFGSLGYTSQYVGDQMISGVELLGYDGAIEFEQGFDAMSITMPVTFLMKCPVFKITFGESEQTTTLQEVIEAYEARIEALRPTAGDNTGKVSLARLEELAAMVEEARSCIGGDEAAAIVRLNNAYRRFQSDAYNQGGAPDLQNSTDVTTAYLMQAANFSRTAATNNGKRFGAPLNWTVENFNIPQSNSDGTKQGIDSYSGANALMLGVWNDSGSNTSGTLANARIYRKVTLPAGRYHFSARYNTIYNLGNAYIYAALENSSTADLPESSLAYWPIGKASADGKYTGIGFTIYEEQELLLGFQADLTGNACQEFRADGVKLLRYDLPDGIQAVESTFAASCPYTLTGIPATQDYRGIVIKDGKKSVQR